jgi:trans-2,3-dihydro-3-hydroxyanthranilate isomerase
MPELALTLLDVFTDTPLAGNGLAVVHGADDLDDAKMLAVARETRLSETAFIQRSTREGADYRNRIWTMVKELALAGHPSLGAAVAVARARGVTEARFTQETPAGLQPVDVRVDGVHAEASMLQEPAAFGALVDPARALAPVGLAAADADPVLPPQVVSTGQPQLLVPVREAALARATPDPALLAKLLDELGALVLYLVACEPAVGHAHARSFLPAPDGAIEDPATGAAAGPLCAYLAERVGCDRVTIEQGIEMGRPSRLDAAIEGEHVRVSGAVVVVADATLLL